MKYSTILIDLDETLLDFYKAEDSAIRKIMKQYGVPETDENVALYSKMNKDLWNALERKEITRQQLFDVRFVNYFNKLEIVADGKNANDDYLTYLSQGHFLLDGALETCEKLSKDYEMYIITNGAKKAQEGRLKNSPLMKYIKGIFISEIIGYVKPEKDYFDYVLSHISEKDKRRILVVGDSLSSDIAGGINSGIDTCWINRGVHQENEATYEIFNISELVEIMNT